MTSLDAHIDRLRQQNAQERANVSSLRLEAKRLRDGISGMTERHLLRRKLHMQRELAKAEAQIHYIESGAKERDMEKRIEPYLLAYASQKTEDVKYEGTFATKIMDRKGSIVKEYLADVRKEVPALQTLSKDDCPMCKGGMVLLQLKALMCCKTCGYATPYLDSTTYAEPIPFRPDLQLPCPLARRLQVEHELQRRHRVRTVQLPAHQPCILPNPPLFPFLSPLSCAYRKTSLCRSSTNGCCKCRQKKIL